MYEFQLIFLPPVVTFVGSRLLDMTDCGRSSLLLNDAKAYNKTRNTTSLARTDGMGGGDRFRHEGKTAYEAISIMRPVEEYAVDRFLDCKNADCGVGVAGHDGWMFFW